MTHRPWQSAAELLPDWRDDVLHGPPPMILPCGLPLDLELGQVTVLGGAPGAGKTALTMQAVVDALRAMPELRAVICNVEMRPQRLLNRQLARLARVPAKAIRLRSLTPNDRARLDAGFGIVEAIAPRLAFVRPPFELSAIAAAADDFAPPEAPLLIVLDYLQRIKAAGEHRDRRAAIDAAMTTAREWADAGAAVLLVSAVGRQRDARGNSGYGGLGLGSFRESSEIEFGGDYVAILACDDDGHRLHVPKRRDDEAADYRLRFDGRYQQFTPIGQRAPTIEAPRPDVAPATAFAAWENP